MFVMGLGWSHPFEIDLPHSGFVSKKGHRVVLALVLVWVLLSKLYRIYYGLNSWIKKLKKANDVMNIERWMLDVVVKQALYQFSSCCCILMCVHLVDEWISPPLILDL